MPQSFQSLPDAATSKFVVSIIAITTASILSSEKQMKQVPNQSRGKLAHGRARAFRLTAQPHADGGEGAIETYVFFLRRIDAAIDSAEEEIGFVTETHFKIL